MLPIDFYDLDQQSGAVTASVVNLAHAIDAEYEVYGFNVSTKAHLSACERFAHDANVVCVLAATKYARGWTEGDLETVVWHFTDFLFTRTNRETVKVIRSGPGNHDELMADLRECGLDGVVDIVFPDIMPRDLADKIQAVANA